MNIGFQEIAKRAPVNVRPLLLDEQRRNPTGAALFAMANQTTGQLVDASTVDAHRDDVDDAGDGRFYSRRERFYTRRVTLMRRCQPGWPTP